MSKLIRIRGKKLYKVKVLTGGHGSKFSHVTSTNRYIQLAARCDRYIKSGAGVRKT